MDELIESLQPDSVSSGESIWLNWGSGNHWLRVWLADEILICFHPGKETEYYKCTMEELPERVRHYLSQLRH